MKVKALKSFCGKLTMVKGEVRECSDKETLADLIRAGYVESAEDTETADTVKKTSAAKTTKRSVKKNEGE